jgi:RNA polymerase sigma factor (TIGR02999 family)
MPEGSPSPGEEPLASEVTRILQRMRAGDEQAAGELFPRVYGELRELAARAMGGERADHTLQPTALVNEAWLKLAKGDGLDFENRRHFFSAAAQSMRRILIDHARSKKREKRGGGAAAVELDPDELARSEDLGGFLAVHEALERLEERDETLAELVRLRYFAGLGEVETAEVLGISERTLRRDWALARAFLARVLDENR